MKKIIFAVLFLCMISGAFANLNTGLINYWPLENNLNNTVAGGDSFTTEAGFVANYTSWGGLNGLSRLSGNTGYVSADGKYSFTTGSGTNLRNVTLNAWVRWTETSSTNARLTVSTSKSDLCDNSRELTIRRATGQTQIVSTSCGDGGASTSSTIFEGSNLAYYSIVQYSNSTYQIYVNGSLLDTKVNAADNDGGVDTKFITLFRNTNTGGTEPNMFVSRISVYNQSLNANLVNTLYSQNGIPTQTVIESQIYGGVRLNNFSVILSNNTIFNATNGVAVIQINHSQNVTVIFNNFTSNINQTIFAQINSTQFFNYSILNTTALNAFTSAQLLDYNATILQNNLTINANSNIFFYVNTQNITLLLQKNGFFSNITNISLVNGFNQYIGRLVNQNNITVNFYDEDTFAPINSVEWFVVARDPNQPALNGITTGSNFTLQGIQGNFEIRYNKTGYEPRSYFFTLPLSQVIDANLSLFLLSTPRASQVLVKVTDKNNQFIDGLTVSLLRRYAIQNQTQFYVVEQARPIAQLQGQTLFSVVPNTIAYIFRVTNEQGQVVYQGSGTNANNFETTYIVNSQLFIKLDPSSNIVDSFKQVGNAQIALTNSTNAFVMSFTNTASEFSAICLQTKKNNREVINNQCSTADSGVLTYSFTPENNSYYVAQAIVVSPEVGSNTVALAVIDNTKTRSEVFGYLGIFFLFMTIVAFSVAFAFNPTIMIIMQVIAVMAFGVNFLGLVAVGPIVQGTILILGIVAAVVLKGRFI